MKNKAIVIEQIFDKTINEIWEAITDHSKMIQWFFENIPDFKAEQGYKTEFIVTPGERSFTHLWEIIEVIPGKKIVYDWRYEEYTGNGKVSFELFEEDEGCKLVLTNIGLETFQKGIPEFSEENCRGGWNYFIKDRLKSFMDK